MDAIEWDYIRACRDAVPVGRSHRIPEGSDTRSGLTVTVGINHKDFLIITGTTTMPRKAMTKELINKPQWLPKRGISSEPK